MIIQRILFSLFLFFSLCVGLLIALIQYPWVDFGALEQYNPGRGSIVLDDEGIEWARFQLDKREPIALNALPPHLINAFLAAEDKQFYSHPGLSIKGIIRSLGVNLYYGRKVQGASTITQQLVKLLFFDSGKTFSRKIKEQLCALQVEQLFGKDQLLEVYLNHVYFGCGIYGVEAACQRFWGVSAAQCTIGQAALLAGIIRNPARYCPLLCPLSAQQLRNAILVQMHQEKMITYDQMISAQQEPLALKQAANQGIAPHLKESLRQWLEDRYGKVMLYTGGLKIQTTINSGMQRQAERAFYTQCKTLRTDFKMPIDGGMMVIDTKTGGIKALVGGADFAASTFNRALQAQRQAGSVFKPLVYAVAANQGISFAHTEIDEPISIDHGGSVWAPRNYNEQFNGQITLAYALSHSNNIATIKTLLRTGIQPVIQLAKQCGMRGPFYPYPSLALGCVDTTVSQVAGMFNIFANEGVYVEPHWLSWVKNEWGKKIYKIKPLHKRVLSTRTTGQVAKALMLGLARIRGLYGNREWVDAAVIGKTGTTNDSRTCWFAGSTPALTTVVYIGCDDNRSLGKKVFPLVTAFPIWLSFNRAVGSTPHDFVFDPSLREVFINERTGEVVDANADGAIAIFV